MTTGPHAALTELLADMFVRLQDVPPEAAVEIRRFTARVPLPLGELESKVSVCELLWCGANRGLEPAKANCTRRTWNWPAFPWISVLFLCVRNEENRS